MSLRSALLKLHLVVGLVAGALLLLLGLSGALLVFEDDIDRALNPHLTRVQPRGEKLSLDAIAAQLARAHPGAKAMSWLLPKRDDGTLRVMLRTMSPMRVQQLAVDPFTGEELGSFENANGFTRQLHQFHKNLLLADVGKTITGWGAGLLLVLAASGIVLWWPRKLRRFGPGAVELHHTLGFYSSVFMVLFAATGLVIHWDDEAMSLVNRLADTPPWSQVHVSAPPGPVHGGKVGADRAIALALAAAPGAQPTSVQGLGGFDAIRVTMRFPEDRTPLGRTNVFINPFTDAVVATQSSRAAPAGFYAVKVLNRQLHTGDVFGWPSRIVACAASLALPLLVVTGWMIWWSRFRRRVR